MAAAIVLGLVFTLIYYFARYYVKTDVNDTDVAAHLKKLPAQGPADLREALKKTRSQLWGRIESSLASDDIDALEEVLFTSDMGPVTAQKLFSRIGESSDNKDIDSIKKILRTEMQGLLQSSEQMTGDLMQTLDTEKTSPMVWLVVGVNGVGKTSTIGKLAYFATQKSMKVLIVAGDTFRAAADAQLKVWAERSACEIYSSEATKDPAAVAYAALEKAKAEKFDLVIVDTAGRLHTQDHLMEELKKVKKVIGKVDTQAPHETLLVLDANSGQNALTQAKMFNEAISLSGIIMTKMDGTSKGGVLLGISSELKIPVRYIGVGEAIEDLRAFNTRQFIESIL